MTSQLTTKLRYGATKGCAIASALQLNGSEAKRSLYGFYILGFIEGTETWNSVNSETAKDLKRTLLVHFSIICGLSHLCISPSEKVVGLLLRPEGVAIAS